jgi:phosphoserine phosphatase RsbU/P
MKGILAMTIDERGRDLDGPTFRRNIPIVLIADDDITSTRILQSILIKEGFAVITAANGLDAKDLALREQPDLILMDIHMPGEDGLSACTDLKANAKTTEIPVVFISSMEDVKSKIAGFDAGGVDYITKPYHPQEVLARVRLHIRLHYSYRKMFDMYLEQLSLLANSQKELLPKPEVHPEAHFEAVYQPSHFAGGDFYDVIQVGKGIYDYIVADVSGHDAGTALATSALKALIHQNAEMFYSPMENLILLNSHLRPVLQEGQYITLVYARVNRILNRVTIINAGHPPAIVHKRDFQAEVISQYGDLLGIFDTVHLEPVEILVAKGDRLFLISDGLIEQGPEGSCPRSKGTSTFLNICNATHSNDLQGAVKAMADQLLPDPENLLDDVVLLGLEI